MTLSLKQVIFGGTVLMSLQHSNCLAVTTQLTKIPEEYESVGGGGEAFGNGGASSADPFAAVRANPALLSTEKVYALGGSYHWPASGREYFQAGVVDGKTSSVAAGLSYTSFTDDYQSIVSDDGNLTGASPFDSPILKRGAIALAQNLGKVAIGVGGSYVESHTLRGSQDALRGEDRIKGVGFNAGVAAYLRPDFRIGASAENISNRKIAAYLPRTIRTGITYAPLNEVELSLDARQRDRVLLFESQLDLNSPTSSNPSPERLAIAAITIKPQDYLRLIASYGAEVGGTRKLAGAGIALVNKNFSLVYTGSRPYLADEAAHQALSLTLDMAI